MIFIEFIYLISVQSGNGFKITLSAVPEPSLAKSCQDYAEIVFEYNEIKTIECGDVKKSVVIIKEVINCY